MTDLRERILAKLDEWTREEDFVTAGPWWVAAAGDSGRPLLKYRYDDVPTWLAEASGHPAEWANFKWIASSRTVRPLLIKALRGEVERHYVAFDVSHTEPLDDAECGCRRAWPCSALREIARNLGVEEA